MFEEAEELFWGVGGGEGVDGVGDCSVERSDAVEERWRCGGWFGWWFIDAHCSGDGDVEKEVAVTDWVRNRMS